MKFATYYETHMSFFIKRLFVPSMLLVLSGFCLPDGVPCAADRITEDNLPQLLEKALLEHPDIVLDVLRRNSEAVLDIAQQGSNMRRKRNLETQWREDTKTPKSVRLAGRPALGSPKAKVNVVAFSDFTCHFCQQASKTVDALLREYGKDISLVFKNLPFDEKGPGGQAAAYFVAISQQSEEKAWKFYKVLFADRDRLVTEGEDFLKKTAQDLEVDMKRLARDIRSKKVSYILA